MDPAARKAEGQKRYRHALATQFAQHFGPERAAMRSALAEGKPLEWMRPEWTRSRFKSRAAISTPRSLKEWARFWLGCLQWKRMRRATYQRHAPLPSPPCIRSCADHSQR